MNDYSITITSSVDTVTFDSLGVFRLVSPIRGWGLADIRTSSELNSGTDGGYIPEQFYGFRQIPIEVVLKCNSLTDFRNYQSKLFNAIPLNETLQVMLQLPTNERFVSFARLTNNMDPRTEIPGRASYSIELLAEDPIIYDFTEGNQFEQTIPKRAAGGLLWESNGLYWDNGESDAEPGLFWEPGSQGIITNNTGVVDVYPDIVVNGSAVNPVLRNDTVGEELSFNLTMIATDTLNISMYLKTATLNGMNVFNSLDSDDFWYLAPGLNRLFFETSGASDTATALVRWRPGYRGIM